MNKWIRKEKRSDFVYADLGDYPLDSYFDSCWSFENLFDWDGSIQEDIQNKGAAVFDITSILDLYPHLTIDENYRLYCYTGREYHGLYSRFAAIANGRSYEPEIKNKREGIRCFNIPEHAIFPTHVIFNDGTPYGFFEAALLNEHIEMFPLHSGPSYKLRRIITSKPEDFDKKWDVYYEQKDWSPKIYRFKDAVYDVRLYACWYNYSSEFLPDDGRDSIHLGFHQIGSYLGCAHHSGYSSYCAEVEELSDTRQRCMCEDQFMPLAKKKA